MNCIEIGKERAKQKFFMMMKNGLFNLISLMKFSIQIPGVKLLY